MPYSLKFNTKKYYKAAQCTDLNDIETTLEQLKIYAENCRSNGYQPPRSYYIRLRSLNNKKNKLLELHK